MHFARGRDYAAGRAVPAAGGGEGHAAVGASGGHCPSDPGARRCWRPCQRPRRGPSRNSTCSMALGPALMATKGWAAPEVEQTYARARVLCAQVRRDTPALPDAAGLMSVLSQPGSIADRTGAGRSSSTGWPSARPCRRTAWRPMTPSGRPCSIWATMPRPGRTSSRASPSPTRRRSRPWRSSHGVAPGVACLAYAAPTLWCSGLSGAGPATVSGGLAAGPGAGASPESGAGPAPVRPTCITAAARSQRSRRRLMLS